MDFDPWLYKHSRPGQKLDLNVFRKPPSAYRGAPLWSWNNELREQQLLVEIGSLHEMGMGGYHIHSRVGLDTEYLGPEFMDLVRKSVDKGKELGMLTWLYDEDRWPSGGAGGLVSKANPQFRAKQLLWTSAKYGDTVPPVVAVPNHLSPTRNENGELLATFFVQLDGSGRLRGYEKLYSDTQVEQAIKRDDGRVWYAYMEYSAPSPWFNNGTYIDTLNKDAIGEFINQTHEKYYDAVGEEFGKSIPSMFCDEPQFVHKGCFVDPLAREEACVPWTTDLPQTYFEMYKRRIEDHIPELFWQMHDGSPSKISYHYHDHICERFSTAFPEVVGKWCAAHNLISTGHMMHEHSLVAQAEALGEAMRCYRAFSLPGIDMLQDVREFTTAKQAQSAVRQMGKQGLMCEIYGVTNWDFSFMGHKNQGDWLAALGVTSRVHHLSWVSMLGEAKRDYPACIGYQSPWYKEYNLVETYFARLGTILTRGKPVVRVGVIHPIESYWHVFGPWQHTLLQRNQLEEDFQNLCEWLLFGLYDWDYISESLFPELTNLEKITSSKLPVGHAQYDVIIVPSVSSLRHSTTVRLEKFRDNGGHLVFAGDIPTVVDGVFSDLPKALADKSVVTRFSKKAIYEQLRQHATVTIKLEDPSNPETLHYSRYPDTFLYQLRSDTDADESGAEHRYLFVCNTDKAKPRPRALITVEGGWKVRVLDAHTGNSYDLESKTDMRRTTIYWSFPPTGSVLFHLLPTKEASTEMRRIELPDHKDATIMLAPEPASISLDEPNLLLLDIAEFKLDEGEWEGAEEVLRIDNELRTRLQLPLKGDHIEQPWVGKATRKPHDHHVSLRYTITSDVEVHAPLLAVEKLNELTSIRFGGQDVQKRKQGYYVDMDIDTVVLPSFRPGTHVLEISLSYGFSTNLEWAYLLGTFGVSVVGRHKTLVASPSKYVFGDFRSQGLPFYGGNMTLNIPLNELDFVGKDVTLRVRSFTNPCLGVLVDGIKRGTIAFAPYEIMLGDLKSAKELQIVVYGNRYNTFAHLHFDNDPIGWCSADSWRTKGDQWTYLYLTKESGLTCIPELITHG